MDVLEDVNNVLFDQLSMWFPFNAEYCLASQILNLYHHDIQMICTKTGRVHCIISSNLGKASDTVESTSQNCSEMLNGYQFVIYLCFPPHPGYFSISASGHITVIILVYLFRNPSIHEVPRQ